MATLWPRKMWIHHWVATLRYACRETCNNLVLLWRSRDALSVPCALQLTCHARP